VTIENRFGASSPFSIGVEEEVMILDAETLEPVAGVQTLVAAAQELTLPGTLKTELHASVVELATGICATPDEAVAALAELRAAAAAIAERNGWRIGAAGMHPTARAESLPVVQEQRYLDMVERIGSAARLQGVNGLHVHVGVESGDACHAALEAVLPWLPVVLALSANSPFVAGEANGMWSNRAPVLAALPRSGAPPAFASYAAWEAWVDRLVGLGVFEDYTRVWWDVRPHPRLGTLEVRMPDQPTALERTALLVRLLRELVATAPRREADPERRGDYAQNRWAAARAGLEAELIHPDGDRVATARELAAELLGSDPPEPEAARQLEVGVAAAAAGIVARTLG
jgi:glutamate---cysteine ligase / carboxylate-amine ligase